MRLFRHPPGSKQQHVGIAGTRPMPRKVRKGHRGGAKLRLRRLTRSLYEVPKPGNLLGIDTPHESWMTIPTPSSVPTRQEEPITRDPTWVLHKIDFAEEIKKPTRLYSLAPGDPRVHFIKTPPRPTGPYITSIVDLETKPVTINTYSRFRIKINEETRPLVRLHQSHGKIKMHG